jgi:hypothetical protein
MPWARLPIAELDAGWCSWYREVLTDLSPAALIAAVTSLFFEDTAAWELLLVFE